MNITDKTNRATGGVGVVRLYLLRAGYLLLVVGLGLTVWPQIRQHAKSWELMHGVVACMLGAISALALLGLRYPLQMLPLLFFEVTWKAIWLVAVALPAWTAHRMDSDTSETAVECLMAAVFLAVVPWDHVVRRYVRQAGDRWRRAPA